MNGYKRWVCGLLAVVLLLLTLCGALVYGVDPCLYYRIPADGQMVFFNERYQNAGLAKKGVADTLLLGTSMVANYRVSQVEAIFGGKTVKLTIPDGYLSEMDRTLRAAFRHHVPRRVLLALDPNVLMRDESGLTGALPAYLYNENPLDDLQYLLNRDTLYYSAYTLLARQRGGGERMDDAFTWDDAIWWNHMTALAEYQRPEPVESALPADAYLANTAANLQVVEDWLTDFPDTEFDIFFPPYSILYWDKIGRLGETDAVFSALEKACDTLLAYEQVRLHSFLTNSEIVTNLDNYSDYIHHSGAVSEAVLQGIQAGDNQWTQKTWKEILANWHTFVVDYDYEVFWNESYWISWNAKCKQSNP